MKENYNSVEDLITDESFVAWVYRDDKNVVTEWDNWIANNPSSKEMVPEAISILNLIRFRDTPLDSQQIELAASRLHYAIQGAKPAAKIINIKRRRIWFAAAAMLIISLAFGLGLIFKSSGKSQLATNYGQVKQNKLPDGTEVILNAHSTLTYGKNWQTGITREVWIKGEAFFHVKKTPTHDKFIVHTDAFDIEVTGTSFNVINLDGKSSIILKEGSVKIHRAGESDILMKPGDLVEFDNEKIEKKIITKQDYLAWTDNKLVFDNTPLTTVANIIKQHYGIAVTLKGDNTGTNTINGIMANDNLDVLLQALDAIPGIKIIHTSDSITIITENQ